MNSSQVLMVIAGIVAICAVGYFGYRWYLGMRGMSQKVERTLAIIKPDAVRAGDTGKIIDRIEQEKFTVLDLRKVKLETEQAEHFYEVHKGKPFFHELVEMMTSGPVVVMVLEKVNAIQDWRKLMGATDPAKADEGTLRKQFGQSMTKNALHGSDSTENADREIKFFFTDRMK